MSIKEEIIKQIFSESDDIQAVFEILGTNSISTYKILDEKKHKPSEILPFLQDIIKEIKKICAGLKDKPIEIIANTNSFTYLITTIKIDGSSLILMLPKESNIGVAKVIAQKAVAQWK